MNERIYVLLILMKIWYVFDERKKCSIKYKKVFDKLHYINDNNILILINFISVQHRLHQHDKSRRKIEFAFRNDRICPN